MTKQLLIGFISLIIGQTALAVCGGARAHMDIDSIQARLQSPAMVAALSADGSVAAVEQAVGPVALAADAGEKIYGQYCGICHTAGIAGAPKYRDTSAWAARIERGFDSMWENAIKGINGMPAKGTCMSCSDEEIKVAIEWMLPQ